MWKSTSELGCSTACCPKFYFNTGLLSIPHILPVPDDVKDSYVSEYEHMIYRKMLPGVGFSLLFGKFEESVSKDSRVSVKKDDGEA